MRIRGLPPTAPPPTEPPPAPVAPYVGGAAAAVLVAGLLAHRLGWLARARLKCCPPQEDVEAPDRPEYVVRAPLAHEVEPPQAPNKGRGFRKKDAPKPAWQPAAKPASAAVADFAVPAATVAAAPTIKPAGDEHTARSRRLVAALAPLKVCLDGLALLNFALDGLSDAYVSRAATQIKRCAAAAARDGVRRQPPSVDIAFVRGALCRGELDSVDREVRDVTARIFGPGDMGPQELLRCALRSPDFRTSYEDAQRALQ